MVTAVVAITLSWVAGLVMWRPDRTAPTGGSWAPIGVGVGLGAGMMLIGGVVYGGVAIKERRIDALGRPEGARQPLVERAALVTSRAVADGFWNLGALFVMGTMWLLHVSEFLSNSSNQSIGWSWRLGGLVAALAGIASATAVDAAVGHDRRRERPVTRSPL